MTIDEAEKIKTVVENKDYIVQLVNTVAKTMVEAFENLKIEDVNMFQLGYNKAIDDTVRAIKGLYTFTSLEEEEIDEMTRQLKLKAGGGEYNDGWIPCSERLPEEELEKAKKERGSEAVFPVLATINKKHVVTGEKYTTVSRAFYGCYNDKNFYNACCDKLDVIAWQPLPEPYKERD